MKIVPKHLAFFSDGTCLIPNEYGTGTYTFLGDNQIKITNFYGETEVGEYEFFDDNTLKLGGLILIKIE